MSRPTVVAVTGGVGFIGRAVVARLREAGHSAISISRTPGPGVDVVDDLSDASRLGATLVSARVTTLCHCAWVGHPRQGPDYSHEVSANLVPTLNVGVAAGGAKLRTVVFLSSGGGIPRARDASTNLLPAPSAYGWAKLVAEAALTTSAKVFDFNPVVLRPSAVYGPGQDPDRPLGAVGVFARRLARGEPIEIYGDPASARDFLHVSDLADLVVRCVDSEIDGVFEAGGPDLVSLVELIELLADASGKKPDVRYVASSGVDPLTVRLDNGPAAVAFGWTPFRRVADAIGELLAEHQPVRNGRRTIT